MPDREMVICHLNDCMEESRPGNAWVFVRKDIVEDAITLLKEQEAKPSIHVYEEYPEYCDPDGWNKEPCIIDKYKCPKCGRRISKGTKFCSNCGQEVKWND